MLASRASVARPCAVLRVCAVAPVKAPRSARRLAATAADEFVDNAFVYGESEAPSPGGTSGTSEAGEFDKGNDIPLPTYHLNVLYLEKCVGLAVDQRLASGERAPVTEYFMWPAKDAWDQLKTSLEGMPWISQTDGIHLLNSATQVINYWQDEEVKHTMEEAQVAFPEIMFLGA